MINSTHYNDYVKATEAAIASKSPVCVLAKKGEQGWLVAKTPVDQGSLIKQGYRPA